MLTAEKYTKFWESFEAVLRNSRDSNMVIQQSLSISSRRPSDYSFTRDVSMVQRPFESSLKRSIQFTFDLMKELPDRSFRLSKGELYAILFAAGFPMGYIAKLLLDGNLGPIRNAVILHRISVSEFLYDAGFNGNYIIAVQGGFDSNYNARMIQIYLPILVSAYRFGGSSLVEKFTSASDILKFNQLMFDEGNLGRDTLERLNRNGRQRFIGTSSLVPDMIDTALAVNAYFANTERAGRRGVRRTGLTTSRAVERVNTGQETPSVETAGAQGSSVSNNAVSNRQVNRTPRTQTPVRDIKFTNTVGIEIELVVPRGVNLSQFDKDLVEAFRKIDVPCVPYEDRRSDSQINTHWDITRDGSIRPEGREIVAPILKGEEGIEQARKVIHALTGAGGSINKSVGIHVHFGAQGMELEHMKNLIYNYAGFQPIINKFLHPSRVNNGYARPIFLTEDLKAKIDRATNLDELTRNVFGGRPVSQAQYDRYPSERYFAINFFAYLRIGTIEFRQLQGSLETDTIIYWVYWLHFLWEASRRKRLSFFDYKQVRNITPSWLSTWLGNRAHDMSGDNFNSFTG